MNIIQLSWSHVEGVPIYFLEADIYLRFELVTRFGELVRNCGICFCSEVMLQ